VRSLKNKLLREEGGFTLPEMLVTMLMMLTVMFALYSIFDMGIRVFSFGNDKVEAVENARLGMERMEREIRAAYPPSGVAGDGALLYAGSEASRISFGNDLNGDRVVDPTEVITYDVYRPTGSSADALGRKLGSGDRSAVVEYVDGLTFEYRDKTGNPVAYSGAYIVRITLSVKVEGVQDGTQTLMTDVALRNRSNP
jgi:prepilin-type N-terminal cleavage/methylation domain-containing protein